MNLILIGMAWLVFASIIFAGIKFVQRLNKKQEELK
jgi:hypothetical protein